MSHWCKDCIGHKGAELRSLGIRCASDAVHYAVVESREEGPVLIEKDKFQFAKAGSLGRNLASLSQDVVDLVSQLSAETVGIKLVERQAFRTAGAKRGLVRRMHLEGALISALGAAGVPITLGMSNELAKLAGSQSMKAYRNSDDFRGLDGYGNIRPREAQEAAYVALVALTIQSSEQAS